MYWRDFDRVLQTSISAAFSFVVYANQLTGRVLDLESFLSSGIVLYNVLSSIAKLNLLLDELH